MRFFQWLTRRDPGQSGPTGQQVDEMLERVLNVVPRLRILSSHKERLAPALSGCLQYLEGVVAGCARPLDAAPGRWGTDPRLRAFFTSPAEVSLVFGRSWDIRTFFADAPGAEDVYAMLGMRMDERNRLGMAQDGDATRADVVQAVVAFSDHRIPVCARTLPELRQEVVRRLVDQLALVALARMAAGEDRREELMRERALLATRMGLLQRKGTGVRSLVGSGEVDSSKLANLRELISENERDLEALGSRSEALNQQIECMAEVLRNPKPLVQIWNRSVWLSRMNVVLSPGSTEMGDLVEFQLAHVPGDPPQERAFAMVRFFRADLPQQSNPLEEAERWLG